MGIGKIEFLPVGTLRAPETTRAPPLLGEVGLDISLTGFEAAEIDSLMGDLVDREIDPVDEPPPLREQSAG